MRVRPGDILRIQLVNRLEEPTNLHMHGLHVSPEDNGDNVFVVVDPGDSFSYEYRLPGDHPPGVYWYHARHAKLRLGAALTAAGVFKMLEEGRDCEDVVTQLAAGSKALDRARFAIATTGLQQCLTQGEGVDSVGVKKMEKLFLSLA